MADKSIDSILTSGTMVAGIAGTFVYVGQTPWAVVSSLAIALKTVDEICAQTIIGTGVAGTVINVHFTVQT